MNKAWDDVRAFLAARRGPDRLIARGIWSIGYGPDHVARVRLAANESERDVLVYVPPAAARELVRVLARIAGAVGVKPLERETRAAAAAWLRALADDIERNG